MSTNCQPLNSLFLSLTRSRLILERATLVRIEWNYKIGKSSVAHSNDCWYSLAVCDVFRECPGLLFAGFGVSQFLFYTIMPQVMKFSSALVVNLSLLTADFYTLLFGIFVFHYKV